MARRSKPKKSVEQIHFVVTNEFKSTANEFFEFCDEHDLNASKVIRSAMKDWLDKQKQIDKKISESEKRERTMAVFAKNYEEKILNKLEE